MKIILLLIAFYSYSERPEIKIDWRIYTKNPDNPLIRDLIIEGLSLARTQKEEFASILNSNNGNIECSLFKVLEEFSIKINKFIGGPARTRTWDQYIMSVLL